MVPDVKILVWQIKAKIRMIPALKLGFFQGRVLYVRQSLYQNTRLSNE